MYRRSFIKTLVGGAALLGLGQALGRGPGLTAALAQDYPDLVAIKGADITVMFDQALTALGGLGRFVTKGQKVLIKPNMGWAVEPRRAANTSPELLAHLVKRVKELGASKISVFDNTCDNWKSAYSTSGLEEAASKAGALVAPANSEKYFQKITIPGQSKLGQTAYHELYLEADVIINLPVLKHHGGAKMTAALKNLMGAIWDRSDLHWGGLDQCIPELMLYKKPNLNIVEAQRVMLNGGPRGYGDSQYLAANMLLASADPVAVDAASYRLLAESGIREPGYIAQAASLGLGQSDLSLIKVQRLTV
ncbi:MAG: DUF362 domain-containing protein [Deltaproteobacteria bacterium]|jgi:uncharacterized protein (DUF362 family)|nr:DUF362 domain-containing protein [Deltaproteobacteria bacterium]